jgi:AcrR family transcriptional regulator
VARPREFDEQFVLNAVRDAFWARGFAATSVDDLMLATNLSKGSLYGAFGTKRDIYLRVFDEYCTSVTEQTQQMLDGPPETAMDRIAAYVRGVAAQTGRDTARRGCLMAKGVAELSDSDPQIVGRASEAMAAMEAQLARTLRQARRRGDLTSAASVPALARTLLAALRGIEALGKAGASPKALGDIAETTIALLAPPRKGSSRAAATPIRSLTHR